MKKIGDLLNLKDIQDLDPSLVKRLIAESIKNNFGINISHEEIILIARTIRFNTSPIKKQEILLRKKDILEKLKNDLPNKNYTEIV